MLDIQVQTLKETKYKNQVSLEMRAEYQTRFGWAAWAALPDWPGLASTSAEESHGEGMTTDELNAVTHRDQLKSEKDINDFVLLKGAGLTGYAKLPLTVANCILFGTTVLSRLPKTAEESATARMVPLSDRPAAPSRITHLLEK